MYVAMPLYSYEQFSDDHNISKIDLIDDANSSLNAISQIPEEIRDAWNIGIDHIGTLLDYRDGLGMLVDTVKNFYIPYWIDRELNINAGEQDRPDLWKMRIDNLEIGYASYNYAKWDDTTNSSEWVVEFGRYMFNPDAIVSGSVVFASNHVYYYAAQNDGAISSDKCSVSPSSDNTWLFGNKGYTFCRRISNKWYPPYTSSIFVATGQKSYDYAGGENGGNQHVAVKRQVTLTTNKANKTDINSRYIPPGSYTYDQYKQALVDDYNEDHPDDPVSPDDLPTLEELAIEFGDINFPGIEIPDKPDNPDNPSDGCCYCEHNYHFDSADIYVSGDLHLHGNVTINNDYNITIDGTMLEGEEIEDIHTEIASEPVKLETMPSRPKDSLGADIIKFVPDAVRSGFTLLEGLGLDTVFEDSAVIAFLFRVMRGG